MSPLSKLKLWIKDLLSYPEIDDNEISESYNNGELSDDRVRSLYSFRRNIFLVVLVLVILYLLVSSI